MESLRLWYFWSNTTFPSLRHPSTPKAGECNHAKQRWSSSHPKIRHMRQPLLHYGRKGHLQTWSCFPICTSKADDFHSRLRFYHRFWGIAYLVSLRYRRQNRPANLHLQDSKHWYMSFVMCFLLPWCFLIWKKSSLLLEPRNPSLKREIHRLSWTLWAIFL